MSPLEKVFLIVGSQRQLATSLGITEGSVSQWKKTKVPVVRCLEIQKLTDGAVKASELRPDVFSNTTVPSQENKG